MTIPIFIALDLETTGLDPTRDRIFEFACIKYENGKQVSEKIGLVNPGVPIPPRVTAITGVTTNDVREKPTWESEKESIAEFLGECPVVAHNALFDCDMLKSHGIPLEKNLIFDTQELAQIFFKRQSSASLESLAHRYNISHKKRHRAEDDAKAASILFQKIIEEMQKLPDKTRKQMGFFLKKSSHPLKLLFRDTTETIARITIPERKEKKQEKKTYIPTKEEKQIIETLQNIKKPLLAEIGPGHERTKTTVQAALDYGKRVLYSYGTRSREEKIKKALEDVGIPIREINNPNQFFCQQQFETWLQKEKWGNDEISFLIKLLVWLPQTETGERNNIWLQYGEENMWYKVAGTENCIKEKHEGCFFQKQMDKCQEAAIVIAHHFFLVQDAQRPQPLLSQRDAIVIDDIEHFERNVTNATMETITERRMRGSLPTELSKAREKLPIFFGLFGIFCGATSDPAQNSHNLIIEKKHEHLKQWQNIKNSTQTLLTHFEKCKSTEEQQKTFNLLRTFVLEPSEKMIRWIVMTRDGMPILKMAPKKLDDIFQKIYDYAPPRLLVGDTCRIQNSWKTLREWLHWNEEETLVIQPEKMHMENIQIKIPEHLPPPNTEGYVRETHKLLKELMQKYKGGIVVIFAARQGLETHFDSLIEETQKQDINLYAETCTGSRRKVIDQFLREPGKSVLFLLSGRGFPEELEGVALRAVLIQKIPFDPPGDPIMQTRIAAHEDPFHDYQVPKAAFRLLHFINSFMDTATSQLPIYLFDTRLLTKKYGKEILDAFPKNITQLF